MGESKYYGIDLAACLYQTRLVPAEDWGSLYAREFYPPQLSLTLKYQTQCMRFQG